MKKILFKDKKRVNLFLTPDLVEKAKIYGVKEKKALSSIVEEGIKKILEAKKSD